MKHALIVLALPCWLGLIPNFGQAQIEAIMGYPFQAFVTQEGFENVVRAVREGKVPGFTASENEYTYLIRHGDTLAVSAIKRASYLFIDTAGNSIPHYLVRSKAEYYPQLFGYVVRFRASAFPDKR